jgi:hypothetical protein
MKFKLTKEEEARLAQVDADIKKWLPDWRIDSGLKYVRWAVLDIPAGFTLADYDLHDRLANFVEEPVDHFDGIVIGKHQYILFFMDTQP